jgi:hypothetical protein
MENTFNCRFLLTFNNTILVDGNSFMENIEVETKLRRCYGCKTQKPLSEFHKNKNVKSGHSFKCKLCVKEYNIVYNKKHAKRRSEYQKDYRTENNEYLCAKEREWYRKNKERTIYTKKIYRREKRKNDPLFRARNAISRRIRGVLKGSKSKKSMDILGCDLIFFKSYMESLFQPGMNWDNYGVHGWHIDHKIPLISGKNDQELEKLCHYTNLQPLWALDNIKKGGKL